jgi:hypothetical protein
MRRRSLAVLAAATLIAAHPHFAAQPARACTRAPQSAPPIPPRPLPSRDELHLCRRPRSSHDQQADQGLGATSRYVDSIRNAVDPSTAQAPLSVPP